MTKAEVASLLAFVYAAYPRASLAQETAAVFAAGLADVDAECARQAAIEWVREHSQPPTLAHIRTRAKDLEAARREEAATQQRLAALPAGRGSAPRVNDVKVRMLLDNMRAWRDGRISTAQMLREGARIYARVPPIPSDGEDEIRAAEALIADLGLEEDQPKAPSGLAGTALSAIVSRRVTGRRGDA